MDFNGWDIIITLLVALYGAILSTYTIINERKEHKREIKVTLSFGLIEQGEVSPPMVILSALNTGSKTVTLSSKGLILPNKKILFFVRQDDCFPFPYDLVEGKDVMVWREAKELANKLKQEGLLGKIKLKGFFRDAIGNRYVSKAVKFDIEDWSK